MTRKTTKSTKTTRSTKAMTKKGPDAALPVVSAVPTVAVPSSTLYEVDPEQDLLVTDGDAAGELIADPNVSVKKALHYRVRPPSLVEPCNTLSTEKRITKLRDKIGVSADHLADELMFAVSSKVKKDKEYIKGLVWSLGVLFDKLNTGNSDTVSVKLPTKLLENIKVVIAIQAEKREKNSTLRSSPQGAPLSGETPSALPPGHDVIDVTPSHAHDAASPTVIPST